MQLSATAGICGFGVIAFSVLLFFSSLLHVTIAPISCTSLQGITPVAEKRLYPLMDILPATAGHLVDIMSGGYLYVHFY